MMTTEKYSEGVLIAGYYIGALACLAVVWASRISILLIVVRLSIHRNTRRVLTGVVAVYVVVCTILMAQEIWTCEEKSSTWKGLMPPQCPLGLDIATAQIVCDVLSDAILIAAPIRLIYHVRLSKAQKVRVMTVFSASAATTAVSICHAYYLIRPHGIDDILVGIIEMSVSLIVANLSVIMAFVYHAGWESSADNGSEPVHIRTGRRTRRGQDSSQTMTGPIQIEIAMETYAEHPVKLGDTQEDPIQHSSEDTKFPDSAFGP